MTLSYFGNTQETIAFAIDEILAELRELHAAMMGSLAEQFTDAEFYALEDKIADLSAVGRSMGLRV